MDQVFKADYYDEHEGFYVVPFTEENVDMLLMPHGQNVKIELPNGSVIDAHIWSSIKGHHLLHAGRKFSA